jgi:hypothetical protein
MTVSRDHMKAKTLGGGRNQGQSGFPDHGLRLERLKDRV